ncbi:MAG: glycosyltransferase family 4 protein [candidate division Zixibacteria bacterium]|nr:glycosyltransferase family 4 protein [candidate division Zixibacteria bacterium]
MKPAVGIDLSPLCWAPPSGISYYAYHLAGELEKLELPFLPVYFFFSHRPLALELPAADFERVKRFPLPMRATKKFWDFNWGQKLLGLSGVDLFFATNSEIPALSKRQKKVMVLHDLSSLRLDGIYSGHFLKHRLGAIRRGIERADWIVVVSEATRTDLRELFSFPEKRCKVIPEGVDLPFFSKTAPNKPYPLPYFFSNGMIQPRKNFVSLAKAFLAAAKEADLPHHLLIAGGDGWKAEEIKKAIKSIDTDNRIQFLGYVSRVQLTALYQYAEAFLFPSLYEGFGLPVLEAMAAGAPVLTSNNSALPEVAGDAAVLVDPNRVEAIKAGILCLATDRDLNGQLRQKGKIRTAEFSFSRTAQLTARFISDVLATKGEICGN